MTIFKKKVLLAIAVFCLLLVNMIGISYAVVNAEPKNYLEIRYETKQTEVYLGENAKVASVLPVYPDKVESIFYTVDSPSGKQIIPDDGAFFVSESGDYIIYVCVEGKDGSTYLDKYILHAKKSEKPILTNQPVLPVGFIEGFAYEIPSVEFIDYNTTSPETVPYQVYLVADDGSESKITDKILPSAKVHGTCVAIKYTAKSEITGKVANEIFQVPVLKAMDKDEFGENIYAYDKMFVTQNVESSEMSEEGTIFYGKRDFSVSFANVLDASFNLVLKTLETYDNFESILITVSDFEDKDVFHTFELFKNDETTLRIIVNEKTEKVINGGFGETFGFGVAFNNRTCVLSNTERVEIVALKETANGKSFTGFNSNRVNVSFKVKNPTALSALVLYKLNEQVITGDNVYDRIAPFVTLEKDIKMQAPLGGTVIVPKAKSYDIIDSNVYTNVSVSKPNGEIVTAADGTVMFEVPADKEYTFTPETIGEYMIHYTAKDNSGNRYDYGYYAVYISDDIAPTLSIKKLLKSEVSVGEEITIPTFSYSDNLTETNKIKAFATISFAHGSYAYLKMGEKYIFTKPGVYNIRYSVMDEFYNITTIEQIVVCK